MYTGRDGEIIVEAKGINTWVTQRGKSSILQKKLLAQLCQLPERVKPYIAEVTPSFRT